MHLKTPSILLAATAAALSSPTRAAESFDACKGYITALPAVISTQGTWCLNKDLATAITTGAAITIAANNVTLDCNDFKVGGLAGGPASEATGVLVDLFQNVTTRSNATIRNCTLRGFANGILAIGDGHVVESNRLDGNLVTGILLAGDGGRVRDNQVLNTGSDGGSGVAGILVNGSAEIIGNTVETVFGNPNQSPSVVGIQVEATFGLTVRDNQVRNIVPGDLPLAAAIYVGFGSLPGVSIRDNHLVASLPGVNGLFCEPEGVAIATGNHIQAFDGPIRNCFDGGGNIVLPVPGP